MTVLNRLIDYFHDRVFDKDPHGVLAMRVQHADGCAWTVADGVLTVMAGGARRTYALQTLTLGQLAARLRADGFTVVNANREIEHLSAFTLVEGSGIQGQTNGDHLTAYSSLLWVLQNAYAPELRHAQYQIGEALRQMVLPQSEQEWLDLWGTLYGVSRPQAGDTGIPTGSTPRPDGSASDDEYSQYIPEEIFRLRVNPLAIEDTIKRKTGLDVQIYEPWKDLFILSESRLDDHRMFDGKFWSPYIIQPRIESQDNIQWDKIRAIIERDRPAGVIPWLPEWVPYPRALNPHILKQQGHFGVHLTHFLRARYEDRLLLDYFALGDKPVENYQIVQYALSSYTNFGYPNGSIGHLDRLSSRRSFVRAQIVLSDMDEPLGHERVIFPRVTVTFTHRAVFGDPEFRLSDYDPEMILTPVEDVEVIFSGIGLDSHVRKTTGMGQNVLSDRFLFARWEDTDTLSSGLVLSGQPPAKLNYGILCPVVMVLLAQPTLFADPRLPVQTIGERIVSAVVSPPTEQAMAVPEHTRATHSEFDIQEEAGTAVLSFGVSVFPSKLYGEEAVTGRYKWKGRWDSRRWNGNVFFNVITETM